MSGVWVYSSLHKTDFEDIMGIIFKGNVDFFLDSTQNTYMIATVFIALFCSHKIVYYLC